MADQIVCEIAIVVNLRFFGDQQIIFCWSIVGQSIINIRISKTKANFSKYCLLAVQKKNAICIDIWSG